MNFIKQRKLSNCPRIGIFKNEYKDRADKNKSCGNGDGIYGFFVRINAALFTLKRSAGNGIVGGKAGYVFNLAVMTAGAEVDSVTVLYSGIYITLSSILGNLGVVTKAFWEFN